MGPQSLGAAWPLLPLPASSMTTRRSCTSGIPEAETPASTCAGWRCWAWVSGPGMGLCWWWRKVSPPPPPPLAGGSTLPEVESPPACTPLPQSPYQALHHPHAGPPGPGALTALLLRAGFYAFSFLSVAMGSTIYYHGKCESWSRDGRREGGAASELEGAETEAKARGGSQHQGLGHLTPRPLPPGDTAPLGCL